MITETCCLKYIISLDMIIQIIFVNLNDQSILAERPKCVKCSVFNPTFIGFEETSSYWSVQNFSSKTMEPYVKTTESYEVCRLGHQMCIYM